MQEGLHLHQHPRQPAIPLPDTRQHRRVDRIRRDPRRQRIRAARPVRPHLHAEEVLAELGLHRVREVHPRQRKEAHDVAEQVHGRVAARQGEPLRDPDEEREELLVIALDVADVGELAFAVIRDLHPRRGAEPLFFQVAGELLELVVVVVVIRRGLFPAGSGGCGAACVQAVLVEAEGALSSLAARRVGLGVADCPCEELGLGRV